MAENKNIDLGTFEVDFKNPRTKELLKKFFGEIISGNYQYYKPPFKKRGG